MPKRSRHYLLTETAERDFREARRWSRARWGGKQTKNYFANLHKGAEYIAVSQNALAERDDLTGTTGLGVHAVGEHYIVYVPVNDSCIVIVALMRQSRDVPAVLKANGYRIRQQLKDITARLAQGKIKGLPN